MAVTFTVDRRGAPLRRTYVSHFDFFRNPQTAFFRTNESGVVTVSNANTQSLDATGPSGTISVRVHAQNAVVRVLDGNFPVPVEVSQPFNVSNGGVININSDQEQEDHFRIMDSCQIAYDRVFRQFRPFNQPGRRAFPFGSGSTVRAGRDRLPRIEVVYPDNGPSPLAFVEPVSVGTGYPLMHIKHRDTDLRLFGVAGRGIDATLIPHEIAHALSFALMPAAARASVETQYLAWIAGRVADGLPPEHNTSLVTSPFVAWIEALSVFSERFFFFSQRRTPTLTGTALRQAFFRDELSAAPLLGTTGLTGHSQVATLDSSGDVQPVLTGDDVEGAVYGALFLDLARRVGLQEAVGLYLDSGDDNVFEFDDFHNLVVNDTAFDADIVAVKNTWGM